MQNQYAGDVSDYAKLALLHLLTKKAHDSLAIGLVWYKTNHQEVDGKKKPKREDRYLREPERYRELAPDLFDCLKRNANRQSRISHIQSIAKVFFPGKSRFFEQQLSFAGKCTLAEKREYRREWFASGLDWIKDCNLVFLDPDTGLEVPSASPGSRKILKYALYQELQACLLRQKTTIVIQFHSPRDNDEYRQIHLQETVNRAAAWTGLQPVVVDWEKGGKLSFLLFPCSDSGIEISHRVIDLPDKYFKIVDVSS